MVVPLIESESGTADSGSGDFSITSTGAESSSEPAVVFRTSTGEHELTMEDVQFALLLLQTFALVYVTYKQVNS